MSEPLNQEGIDVIIVSNAKDDSFFEMTQQCVNSAIYTEPSLVHCTVIEQNPNIEYENCDVIRYNQEFNYNRCLNIGAQATSRKYIAFCNNDLMFGRYWASTIIGNMQKMGINSASPRCPDLHKHYQFTKQSGNIIGMQIGKHLPGWCFVWTRDLYNKIGKLDEDFKFWCSDNATGEQLIAAGEKHFLCCSCEVMHLLSRTLKTLDAPTKQDYTQEEVYRFNKKYGKNLWNMGVK